MQDGLIRSMTRKSASILRVYSRSLLGDNKRAVGYHSTRRPSRTVASWHAPTRSRSMSSEVGEVHHEKAARQLTRWNIGGPRADQALATAGYWDAFYDWKARDQPGADYDWYGASPELFTLLCKRIAQAVPPCVEGESAPVILHLGCGTSALSATLSQSLSGRRVLHSDFSMPGLEVMRARHPLLAWAGMDARALPLRDASVAAVVEKGTMDALLRSGEDDWNDMAKEMLRVLRPGGVFLQVTDEAPELRLPLLEFHQPRWQVSFSVLPADEDGACSEGLAFETFIYTCRKKCSGAIQHSHR